MQRLPFIRLTVVLAAVLLWHGAIAGSASKPGGGTVVVTEPASVSTQQGFFREFALDHLRSGPAIVAVDKSDTVWVGLARSGKLARFSNGKLTLYPIGEHSRPVGVVPDDRPGSLPGTVWIAAAFDNKLVRYNYLTGDKQTIDLSASASWPFMLALAADGGIWFTQRAGNRIGRVDPESLEVRHYELPTPAAGPAGLAIDPTDGSVWFAAGTADRIGRLEPETGAVREYVMGEQATGMISGPAGVAVAPDGHVWFAKLEGMIGHIAPGADHIELIPVPEEARRPAGIAVGPQGDIWALALDGNCILRYRPKDNGFVVYRMPSGSVDRQPGVPPAARTSRPFGLAFDSQGNLWVSEQYTGKLAVLDLAAPTVEIVSPVGRVELADPPLSLRVLDRIAGVDSVEVKVDGRAVPVSEGRLMLDRTLPGVHTLTVTAVDAAGLSRVATTSFDYQPDRFAAISVVSGLKPLNSKGRDLQSEVLASLEQPRPNGGWQDAMLNAGERISRNATYFQGVDATILERLFAAVARNADRRIVVEILDFAPYFSQTEVSVRVGEWITWVYDPPTKGHRLSQKRHRLRIDGADVHPPVLEASGSFSYRFEKPGVFKILDELQPAALATVSVTEK